jgi:hypothetical protein
LSGSSALEASWEARLLSGLCVAPLRLGGLRGKQSTPGVWLGGTGVVSTVGKQQGNGAARSTGVHLRQATRQRYAHVFSRVECIVIYCCDYDCIVVKCYFLKISIGNQFWHFIRICPCKLYLVISFLYLVQFRVLGKLFWVMVIFFFLYIGTVLGFDK